MKVLYGHVTRIGDQTGFAKSRGRRRESLVSVTVRGPTDRNREVRTKPMALIEYCRPRESRGASSSRTVLRPSMELPGIERGERDPLLPRPPCSR